jgi:hypothetical protein
VEIKSYILEKIIKKLNFKGGLSMKKIILILASVVLGGFIGTTYFMGDDDISLKSQTHSVFTATKTQFENVSKAGTK